MCREVFENARVIGLETLEIQLALQCAPVIAGLKISNLLIIPSSQEEKLYHIFRNSEISFFRLLWAEGKSTFLLYRKEMLEAYFMQWEVRTILKEAGYGNLSLDAVLATFRHRFENCRRNGGEFPHEMGILLGYPSEDVAGFIEHKGRDFLYSGYWKVYGNLQEKLKLFHKYETARSTQVQLLACGVFMEDIIDIYQQEWQQKAVI